MLCAILASHDISNTQLYPGPPEVFQVTASSGSLPVPVTLDTHITGQGTEILFYCHTLELGTQSVDGSHQGQVQQTESSGEYQNTQPTLSCIKVSPSIASQSPSVKPVCKDHRSQEWLLWHKVSLRDAIFSDPRVLPGSGQCPGEAATEDQEEDHCPERGTDWGGQAWDSGPGENRPPAQAQGAERVSDHL